MVPITSPVNVPFPSRKQTFPSPKPLFPEPETNVSPPPPKPLFFPQKQTFFIRVSLFLPPLQASQNPGFETNIFPSKTNFLNFSWKHADRVHTHSVLFLTIHDVGGNKELILDFISTHFTCC